MAIAGASGRPAASARPARTASRAATSGWRLSTGIGVDRSGLDERQHLGLAHARGARDLSGREDLGKNLGLEHARQRQKGCPRPASGSGRCKSLKPQQKRALLRNGRSDPARAVVPPGQGSDTGRGQTPTGRRCAPAPLEAAYVRPRRFDEADAFAGREQPRGDEPGVQQRPQERLDVRRLRGDAEQARERARRSGHRQDDPSARPQHAPDVLEQCRRRRRRAAGARGRRPAPDRTTRPAAAAAARSGLRPPARRASTAAACTRDTAASSGVSAYAPPVMPTFAATSRNRRGSAADHADDAVADANAGDRHDERFLRPGVPE